MSALAQAIRNEMFSVLNAGELTPAACSELMRLAEHGRELLRAKSKKPEDFAEGTQHVGDGEVPQVNTETFGVKILQQLLPMLKQLRPEKREDPEQLVRALAVARAEGLADVVEALEKKLGIEKEPPSSVTVVGAATTFSTQFGAGNCPACNSHNPSLHPAAVRGGDLVVENCEDPWHTRPAVQHTRVEGEVPPP